MDDILKSTDWKRGGKQSVLRTYALLHQKGIIGEHWLWCAVERIAGGEPEAEVMNDYGYIEK